MKKILMKKSIALILALCMMFGLVLTSGVDSLAASVEPAENMTDSALSSSGEEELETFDTESGEENLEEKSLEVDLEKELETEPEGETLGVDMEAVAEGENGAAGVSEETVADEEPLSDSARLSADKSTKAYTSSSTGNFSNLVIFVDFADTTHDNHLESNKAECYVQHPERIFELFDGVGNPRGFRTYLERVSYGALQIANLFPQYDDATHTLEPYRLNHTAEYYSKQTTDTEMIQEILAHLEKSGGIDSSVNLDYYGNDGCLDNLTIVTACDTGDENKMFDGHMATYAGDEKINGKWVRAYNFVMEGRAFLGLSQSGLLIHEFLHTLGYPDLYSRNGSETPVGLWDIMARESLYVQYPLAYLRSHYTEWFSIPEVTKPKEGNTINYSLYAASVTTESTKNQQAVIIKTPYSDTEFFVMEYRKKGSETSREDYESIIPGSGLIIYRVNTNAHRNIDGPPWYIYVFRQGDDYNSSGYEQADMNKLSTSFLSLESGRTSFGTSDASKSLADGAITYSDGTNSGIVISNVGSATGDQITFDITFSDDSNDAYWTNVSTQDAQNTTWIDSYMDSDGTIYYLQKKYDGKVYLCRYQTSGWSQLGSGVLGGNSAYGHQLIKYGDSLYVAYIEGFVAKLAKWAGSSWKEVYATNSKVNEFDMASDGGGIYLAYANYDNSQISVYKYTTSGISELGVVAQSSAGNIWSPSITAENGRIVIAYKEFFSGKLYVKQYGNGSWNEIGGQGFTANNGMIKLHKGKVYLLKNGENSEVNEAYLYVSDLNSGDGSWTKVDESAYANESIVEMDICFHGDAPHIIYQGGKSKQVIVKNLGKHGWEQLGSQVTSETISGLDGYSYDGKIYLTYLTTSSSKIYIKSHASNKTEGIGGGTTTTPGGDSTGGTTGGTTGGSTGGTTGGNTGGTTGGTTGGSTGGTTGGNTGGTTGGNTGGNTGGTTKPSATKNGWVYENGQRYFYENGVKARSKEAYVDGYWRWFDADGSMAVSKDVYMANGDKWVRYDANGRMIKGWHNTSKGKYYFDLTTGAMSKGVKNIDGKFYYFSQVTGIFAEYKGEEVPLDGDWYWFDADGTVAVSKDVYQWSSGGKWVRYDANGRMVKGWDNTSQGRYYFDPITGAMSKGIKNIDGKYYYFYQVTGILADYRGEEVPIDGYWRWFDADGTVAVSKDVYQWSSGGKWVRYDAYGGMIKGWDYTNHGTYYFDLITGAMAKGRKRIDGRWYYFDETTGILRW